MTEKQAVEPENRQGNVDLVFEGGGMEDIGLVGTLSVFEERGNRPQNVSGASAGAIVAALHAGGSMIRLVTFPAGLSGTRPIRSRGASTEFVSNWISREPSPTISSVPRSDDGRDLRAMVAASHERRSNGTRYCSASEKSGLNKRALRREGLPHPSDARPNR
jgi:hypothetical protein